MQASLLNNQSTRDAERKLDSEAGITILEMVAAMMVLTVGLLGLAASIGYAVTVSNRGRNLTNTKLVAVSLLEQMETLRNTEQLTFGEIANAGAVDNVGAAWNFADFPPVPCFRRIQGRTESLEPVMTSSVQAPITFTEPAMTLQILHWHCPAIRERSPFPT